jgi:hypothetical protein
VAANLTFAPVASAAYEGTVSFALTMRGCPGSAVLVTVEIQEEGLTEVRRDVEWRDGDVLRAEFFLQREEQLNVRLVADDGSLLFQGTAVDPFFGQANPFHIARLEAVLDCSVQPFRIVSISEGEATILPDGAMSAPRGQAWPLVPIGAALVAIGLLWTLAGVARRTPPRDGTP